AKVSESARPNATKHHQTRALHRPRACPTKKIRTRERTRTMGKRGNGEGSIYQRTLKDGTVRSTPLWCAAVTLDGGKRKILYGKTRGEVARKLNTAIDRKSSGIPFVDERLTVGAWVDHWMAECIR